MKIKRDRLLIEKESGAYGCPNYIDPKYGQIVADSLGLKTTSEGVLLFTEVMENFGIELLKNFNGTLTKEAVIELTKSVEMS